MKNIIELARESGIDLHDMHDEFIGCTIQRMEHFAALIREAVVEELVAEVGHPNRYEYLYGDGCWRIDYTWNGSKPTASRPLYTADQLAGAVLRERERCAQVCDAEATVEGVAQKCAAAIRSGE